MLSIKAIFLPLISLYAVAFFVAVLYMKPSSNFRTLPATINLPNFTIIRPNFPAGNTFKFKNKLNQKIRTHPLKRKHREKTERTPKIVFTLRVPLSDSSIFTIIGIKILNPLDYSQIKINYLLW